VGATPKLILLRPPPLTIVTASSNGIARVWDAANGQMVREVRGHRGVRILRRGPQRPGPIQNDSGLAQGPALCSNAS